VGQEVCQHAARYATPTARAILRGFQAGLARTEPERPRRWKAACQRRIAGLGLRAPEASVQAVDHDHNALGQRAADVHVVVPESSTIPSEGIDIDLPAPLQQRVSKDLLDSCQRLHINAGHPPNADLERVVRLAGGSEEARSAIRCLRCSVCAKLQKVKLPRPARIRDNIGVFSDTVLAGVVFFIKDSQAVTHSFLALWGEGAGNCVVGRLESHRPEDLYSAVETAWLNWAGPPNILVADAEGGISSQHVASVVGRAGALHVLPPRTRLGKKAGRKRRIQQPKAVVKKAVIYRGTQGPEEIAVTGREAASAISQRPGISGLSPHMMLFGQRLRLFGDLNANGEPAGHHPGGDDPASQLPNRLKIRVAARQALEQGQAREPLRKSIGARSRVLTQVAIGGLVFFYRVYDAVRARRLQAARGTHMGPGLVIGQTCGNVGVFF